MTIKLTVPSKTFLLGEYLALEGETSLLLNTEPHFELYVDQIAKKKLIHNMPNNSPAGKFIQNNLDIFRGFKLTFYDPYFGIGGLGSSSAQYCLVAMLKNFLQHQSINLDEFLTEYQLYAWNGKGYKPSGADVVSQLHGGIIFYNRNKQIVKKYLWPFPDISFCLLHTRNKIFTSSHLDAMNAITTQDLSQVANTGIQALENKNLEQFCDAINQYQELLIKKELCMNSTIPLLELIRSHRSVLAVKGCGALCADVIFTLIPSNNLNTFLTWAKSQKLYIIGCNNYINEGLVIRSSIQNKSPHVILVNDFDCQMGVADKIIAHEKALLHRAYSIFVIRKLNDQVEVLLQQRAQNKYHCGGLWSNTCCSHPEPGDTVQVSAHQRLLDEMGIYCQLKEIGVFKYRAEVNQNLTEHEIDHVFIGTCNDKVYPNKQEVADYRWVALNELLNDVKINSHNYTPWFEESLQLVADWLQNNSEFLLKFDSALHEV